MKTSFKVTIAAALLSVMSAGTVMAAEMPTAEQCDAWFKKADTNGDGIIGKSEDANKYEEMMTKASGTKMTGDAQIKMDAFAMDCQKGTFGMPVE